MVKNSQKECRRQEVSCTFKFFFSLLSHLDSLCCRGYRFGFIPDVTYEAGNRVLTHAQMLLDMYTS